MTAPIAQSVVDCPRCGQLVTFEIFSTFPKYVLRPVDANGHVRSDVIVHLTTNPLDHDCPQPPAREPLERAA